jgi:hypothetical protein
MIFAVIAQLKFLATYFIPSLYPSLLMIASAIAAFFAPLAQFSGPPHGTEWPFVLNVIAWLGVLTIAATLALTLKKLFGRQPSLSEVLSGLVSTKTLAEYKEERRLREVGLEKQISEARHAFDARANSDLVRIEQTFERIFEAGEQRDREVRELAGLMARMQERTESHIRTLGQYDTKLDVLRREISETVGALRAARERLEREG